MPFNFLPNGAKTSFATFIALGTPLFNVSYVSTNNTQSSVYVRAYALKASNSLSND